MEFREVIWVLKLVSYQESLDQQHLVIGTTYLRLHFQEIVQAIFWRFQRKQSSLGDVGWTAAKDELVTWNSVELVVEVLDRRLHAHVVAWLEKLVTAKHRVKQSD